jgi:hypothetical protein
LRVVATGVAIDPDDTPVWIALWQNPRTVALVCGTRRHGDIFVLYAGGFCRGASPGSDSGYFGEDIAGEEGLSEDHDCAWLYWCPGLPPERWQEECRLVEDLFSLFRAFAEAPFFGFRGIVARSGSEYRVTVVAEMDMYPKYEPWVYVTPTIAERIASGRGEPIMAPLHQAAWAARDRFQRFSPAPW